MVSVTVAAHPVFAGGRMPTSLGAQALPSAVTLSTVPAAALAPGPGGDRKRRTGVLGRGQALRPPPSEGKGEPPGRKGRVRVPPSAGLSAPVIVRCLKHHSLPDRAALGSDTGVHRGVPTGSALNAAQWHLHFHPYAPPLAARRPFPPKHQATREPFEGKVVSPVRL